MTAYCAWGKRAYAPCNLSPKVLPIRRIAAGIMFPVKKRFVLRLLGSMKMGLQDYYGLGPIAWLRFVDFHLSRRRAA